MSQDETALNNYKVKQGNFEGPLDLLLSLIEQRKLFVNEISLAEVTNDYIPHRVCNSPWTSLALVELRRH